MYVEGHKYNQNTYKCYQYLTPLLYWPKAITRHTDTPKKNKKTDSVSIINDHIHPHTIQTKKYFCYVCLYFFSVFFSFFVLRKNFCTNSNNSSEKKYQKCQQYLVAFKFMYLFLLGIDMRTAEP